MGEFLLYRKKLLITLLTLVFLMCGCSADSEQDKAEVVPYRITENISFKKEVLAIGELELSSPRGIASNGEQLFICDSGNSRIVRCSTDGTSADILGEGTLVEPVCISASDTEMCVYDRGSDRIKALTLDGELIRDFSLDENFDFFNEVVDVELCENTAVYFSLLYPTSHNERLGDSGVYLIKDGKLLQISACTVGTLCNVGEDMFYMSKYELQDDNTWISGYAELLKITGETYERISAFSEGFSAVGLEYSDGKLYAYDSCSQSIQTFFPNGEYIETVFSEPVVNDFLYSGFCGDNDGNFYLCDTNGNTVYKLVKNG